MNKQIDISLGLANSHRMQFVTNRIAQKTLLLDAAIKNPHLNDALPYLLPYSKVEFTPIVSIFIAPRDILLPKNRDYIYIAFDYIPSRDEREIVKISEQHYTSHFPELISLN